MRYRAYFPPGYPYEERARAALEANAPVATDGIVSFRMHDEEDPPGGWKLANLRALGMSCPVCVCEWQVWVPWTREQAAWQKLPGPIDPGKCPACSPVAAELASKERARLLVELAAGPLDETVAALVASPTAIACLAVACDAAQSSRAVPEYRSPRDIARIAELEKALASAGVLV